MAENFGVDIPITADGQGATVEINKVARAIDNMGESSEAASRRVESAQAETQQQLKKTAKTADETGETQETASKKAEKAARKAAQAAQKEWEDSYVHMRRSVLSLGESVNSTMISMAGSIARKGLGAIASTVSSFVGEGFELQKELEGVKVALETMSTAGADADTVLKQIQKDAITTPFDVASLSKATQRFTMITGNAEEAEKTVINFGKALAAAGKGSVEMTRIATNMQQIGNQARISQKDFNEFATAGVNMTKLVADYAKIGENEVMDYLKKWQKGVDAGMSEAQLLAKGVQKPYDILVGAITKATTAGGKFANVYENMAGTLPQVINNMKESVSAGLASVFAQSGAEKELKKMAMAIGEAFTESPLMDEATKAVSHLIDVIKELLGVADGAGAVKSIFGAITNFLHDLASGKYDIVIKNIFGAIKSFLQVQAKFNPLVTGLKLLSAVLKALPEGAGEVLGKIAGGLITLASAIGVYSKIKATFEPLTRLVKAARGVKEAGTLIDKTGDILVKGGGKITGALQTFSRNVASVSQSISTVITSLGTVIKTFVSEIIGIAGAALTSVASVIGDVFGKLGEGLQKFLQPISDPQLLIGVATLATLALSLGVFADSMAKFENVSWESMAKAAATLAAFGGAAVLAGKNLSTLVQGFIGLAAIAGSIAIVGIALGSFATNLAKFAKVSWGDMAKAAAVLVTLTAAMVGLSAIIGFVAVGAVALVAASVGIAAFGASLIAVGAGLKSLGEASQIEVDFGNLLKLVGSAVLVGGAMAAGAPVMAAAAVSGVSMMVMAASLSGAVAAVNTIPEVTRDLGDLLGLVGQLDLLGIAMAAGSLTNFVGALSGIGLLAIATELLGIANAVNAIPKVDVSRIDSLEPAFGTLQRMALLLSATTIGNLAGAISGGLLLGIAQELRGIAEAISGIPEVNNENLEKLEPAFGTVQRLGLLLSATTLGNLVAAISGGALVAVANELKSVAWAIAEIPDVSNNHLDALEPAFGTVQRLGILLSATTLGNLVGAISGGALIGVANELKSIAWAIHDTPEVDTKNLEKLEPAFGIIQRLGILLSATTLGNIFGAISGGALVGIANELKSIAYAMNEASQQLAGIDLAQFDKFDTISEICQKIGNVTDDIPVEKSQRIRDLFDALGDAFDNDVGQKIFDGVTMLRKTNWATFQHNMDVLITALSREYPDLSNFVNFFDRIGDALDNGVIDNMGKLIDTFLKNDDKKMQLAMNNAEKFVTFVQGNDQTKNWNSTSADAFRAFFDKVGDALDQSVVPNISALLDTFNKFNKNQIAQVMANAEAFVNFIQGSDQTKNWSFTTAESFTKFFDQVGWALDNDVSPNIEKLLNVFNKFSKDKMGVVMSNAQSFVDFVQGTNLPGNAVKWNVTCADNFMNFFDRVGWALDNDVMPNIEKMLNVFNKFSKEQIGSVTENAKAFVDFINGDLFQNGEGENAWSLDGANNFMDFFDRVGWALDNNVGPALEAFLKAFNMETDAFSPIVSNIGTLVGVVNGTHETISAAGGWNKEQSENFMNYFDRIRDALDNDVINLISQMFSAFGAIKVDKVLDNAKVFAQLVHGDEKYKWDTVEADNFVAYMDRMNDYAMSPEKIKNFFEGFTNVKTGTAVETAGALAQIISKISEAFATYKPEMERNGATLGDSLIKGWNTKKDAITALGTDAGNSINNAIAAFAGDNNAFYNTAQALVDSLVKPFQNHDWASHGRFAANGIKSGADSQAASIYATGFDLSQSLSNGIKNGGQEGSPWKLTTQSGIFAAQGLIMGAQSMLGDVSDMGEEIANALMTGYNDSIETLTADATLGETLSEANAYGQTQAITNNKNVNITNNNTVNSGLDMAMVNSQLNWEINHSL